MNKVIQIAAAATAFAGLGMSAAQAVEGPYVEGAILQSHFDSHHFNTDQVDTHDISWKAVVGARLTPNFALEGGYTDFGKAKAPSVTVGGPFDARATAFSGYAVGLVPLGPVDLFGKVGAARIDAKGDTGAVFYKDHDTVFAYGAGLQLGRGPFGVRAEYEKFNTNVVGDLDIISLGFVFTFGAE